MPNPLSWRQAAVAALLFNAAVTASYDTRNAEASKDTKRDLDTGSVKHGRFDVRNLVQKLNVDSVLSALGSNKAQGMSTYLEQFERFVN